MRVRLQPHVLGVLADLRADPEKRHIIERVADAVQGLGAELPLDSGDGEMWIVPVEGTDWIVVCSNDEPDVLVVRYLGPALGR